MSSPEPRAIVTLVVLGSGALLSGLILVNTQSTDDKPTKPELSLAYYLDRAELIGTGPDGNILYQVWATRASQSTTDSGVEMANVRMNYGPPNGIPWKLRANTGRMPADASIIELAGNVVATSSPSASSTTTIMTQQLNIDPATQEASTNLKVVIDYNGRQLNASGMLANFATNQVNLLANVNGKFAP